MPLIKCPQCGQTVLSVASSCPRCRFLLTQNPMDHGGPHGLIECRRCGKFVPRDDAICPYCAYPARVRRVVRRTVGAVVGTGLVITAAILAFRSQGGGTPLAEAGTPAGSDTASRVARAPVDTPRVVQPPAANQPATPLATPAERLQQARPVVAAPPLASESTPVRTAGTLQRWTTDWVNVREARAIESPVVRVISPGTQIEVRNRQSGWWELVIDGGTIGYVSGAVLANAPPPDTTRSGTSRDTLLYRE